MSDYFPSAQQVVKMDLATLKTAGLSGRKAEYGSKILHTSILQVTLLPFVVLDLAKKFTEGDLSTEILLQTKDEKLYDTLTAVRGIGRVCTILLFCPLSVS